jgi:hypothetical protein
MDGSDASLLTSGRTSGRQDPMRQPQFIRSSTFHWALAVSAVFAVFVIVLFGFIYWKIDDYLTARSDRVITVELDGIAGLSPERGLQAIDEKLRQDPRGVQVAAIFAADGHRIAGNLESTSMRPAKSLTSSVKRSRSVSCRAFVFVCWPARG